MLNLQQFVNSSLGIFTPALFSVEASAHLRSCSQSSLSPPVSLSIVGQLFAPCLPLGDPERVMAFFSLFTFLLVRMAWQLLSFSPVELKTGSQVFNVLTKKNMRKSRNIKNFPHWLLGLIAWFQLARSLLQWHTTMPIIN